LLLSRRQTVEPGGRLERLAAKALDGAFKCERKPVANCESQQNVIKSSRKYFRVHSIYGGKRKETTGHKTKIRAGESPARKLQIKSPRQQKLREGIRTLSRAKINGTETGVTWLVQFLPCRISAKGVLVSGYYLPQTAVL